MNTIQSIPKPQNLAEAVSLIFDVQEWLRDYVHPVIQKSLIDAAVVGGSGEESYQAMEQAILESRAVRKDPVKMDVAYTVPGSVTPGGIPTRLVPQKVYFRPTITSGTRTQPVQLSLDNIAPVVTPCPAFEKKPILLLWHEDPEVNGNYTFFVTTRPASALASLHSVYFKNGVLPKGTSSKELIAANLIRFVRKSGPYKLYKLTEKGTKALDYAMRKGPAYYRVVKAIKGYSAAAKQS